MIETETETCSRCGLEFDIDQQYLTMEVSHHLHAEAIENGMEVDDEFHIICNECVQQFAIWLDPELDSDADFVPIEGDLFDEDLS